MSSIFSRGFSSFPGFDCNLSRDFGKHVHGTLCSLQRPLYTAYQTKLQGEMVNVSESEVLWDFPWLLVWTLVMLIWML